MTFVVRLVSIAAGGREFVRESGVAGDTLDVGRGTDNQVVLADLAAAPSHARLVDRGDRVVVEALADEPVLVDGRLRRRCEVRLDRPATLRIGGHVLTLERGRDGAVELTIRQDAGPPPIDEGRAFSLAGRLPGKRLTAWVVALAVVALFIAWPIWSFAHRTIDTRAGASLSAGPLTPGHTSFARNCRACHVGAFVAVPDRACASCHSSIHMHADPARLAAARASLTGWAALRQRVATILGKPAGRCADCHVEHHGEAGRVVADEHFCADCHATLKDRLPGTALGNARDFTTLHPQFAPPLIANPESGATRRVSSDAHPRDDTGLVFSHALHLAPGGGVARMALTTGRGRLDCAGCHRAAPDGRGFAPVAMTRDCEGCHSLAYGRSGAGFLNLPHGDTARVVALLGGSGSAAARAAFSPRGLCADCHIVRPVAGGWHVVPVRQQDRFLLHGWFDHASHRATACADCHAARASQQASDVLIPGIATCRHCHGGEGAKPPLVRSTCVLCHDYHRSAGPPLAVRRKGGAPLKLAWGG